MYPNRLQKIPAEPRQCDSEKRAQHQKRTLKVSQLKGMQPSLIELFTPALNSVMCNNHVLGKRDHIPAHADSAVWHQRLSFYSAS